MSNANFDRQYRLTISVPGQSGFEVGRTSADCTRALHISFSIEKSDAESNNSGKITLWNLSKEHLSYLDKKDCAVLLKVGYGSRIATIFSGNITSVITQRDGADTMTEIEAVDGRVALRDTIISESYIGEIYAKAILDDATNSMGVTVVYSEAAQAEAAVKKMPNGFSYVGPAKTEIKKICDLCGLEWSMQNGVLQIKKPGEAISTLVYVLNKGSGLLDIPKRITEASKGEAATVEGRDKKIGWEIRYFMNGAVGVNDYIKLESNSVSGYFYVSKLSIDGDNLGGEWTCTAQIMEVKSS